MMQAIAVDDEPLALEIMKAHAAKIPFLHLQAVFSNALEAMLWLQHHETDLMFLDIKMPDVSGIELYAALQRKPMVIFTTAYAEHAVSGFELDAVDYLMKPVSLARFMKACQKAQELHGYRTGTDRKTSRHIMVKSGTEQVKLELDDILYAEATGNYVTFVMPGKKVLSRATFAEVLQWLPADQFIRIHRSYIVNLLRIEKADKSQVYSGNTALPLSEAFSKDFFEKWK